MSHYTNFNHFIVTLIYVCITIEQFQAYLYKLACFLRKSSRYTERCALNLKEMLVSIEQQRTRCRRVSCAQEYVV